MNALPRPPRHGCPDARRGIALAAVWREAARRRLPLVDAGANAIAERIVASSPAGCAGFEALAAAGATRALDALGRGRTQALARDLDRHFPGAVAHLHRVADEYVAAHANDRHVAACLRGFDCFFGLLEGAPADEMARRCGVTKDNLYRIVHFARARLRPHVRDPLALQLVSERTFAAAPVRAAIRARRRGA